MDSDADAEADTDQEEGFVRWTDWSEHEGRR